MKYKIGDIVFQNSVICIIVKKLTKTKYKVTWIDSGHTPVTDQEIEFVKYLSTSELLTDIFRDEFN